MGLIWKNAALGALMLTCVTGAATAACAPNAVELRGDWGMARFAVEIADEPQHGHQRPDVVRPECYGLDRPQHQEREHVADGVDGARHVVVVVQEVDPAVPGEALESVPQRLERVLELDQVVARQLPSETFVFMPAFDSPAQPNGTERSEDGTDESGDGGAQHIHLPTVAGGPCGPLG